MTREQEQTYTTVLMTDIPGERTIHKLKDIKITRSHNFKLVKEQSRLDVRKYSFSQRTINVWNT